MKIGIMGGTFNPIHNGHLFIAEYARVELDLDKVIFIPTGDPSHKDIRNNINRMDRFEMTRLAIEGNCNFEISDIEILRRGKTYTIDTLKSLREEYPGSDLYFIIGEDSLFSLDSWVKFQELTQLCSFLVFNRKNISNQRIEETIAGYEAQYGARLSYIKAPIVDISSSMIRERIMEDKSIRYMVPLKVEKYIINNSLYGDE